MRQDQKLLYGQIINKLNSQKDNLDKNGELFIGHRLYHDDLKKELEQIDKFINNLGELEGMFRGTIPLKEEIKAGQAIDDDSTHSGNSREFILSYLHKTGVDFLHDLSVAPRTADTYKKIPLHGSSNTRSSDLLRTIQHKELILADPDVYGDKFPEKFTASLYTTIVAT